MSHTLINCTCKNRLGFSLLLLLWYHSILRGSIDQKHAKTNEIWRQNSEIHSAFYCSHWPPWLPDLLISNRKAHAWSVEVGNRKQMFRLSLFRPSRQSNISTSGEERFKYPLPQLGEQDQSNTLPQGQQRQSNPYKNIVSVNFGGEFNSRIM